MASQCFPWKEKPEKRVVRYIQNKNEDAIREMMEEFSLSERQKIFSRKVKGKSVLIYACEYNTLKTVLYLITECGADVQEVTELNGELLTPLFVAAKYGDAYLIDKLIYLGADVCWTDNEDRNALVYACLNNNMNTAAALRKLININCIKNMNLCIENEAYLKRAFLLGAQTTFADEAGNTILMKAVIQEKYDIVRALQDYYAYNDSRNNMGANALDIAVMRGDVKMKMLLREDLYTLQDEILSLEYCGARFIIYNKLEMGKDLWEKSLDLRSKNTPFVTKKQILKWDKLAHMSVEFDTARGLKDVKDLTDYMLQAILVYLRILSPKSPATASAIKHVINSNDLDDEDPLRFCLLNQLLAFNEDTETPGITTATLAINTAISFFQRHLENTNVNNRQVNVNLFLYLVDFIVLNVAVFINEHSDDDRYFYNYKELLYTSLHYLEAIMSGTVAERGNTFLAAVREISNINIIRYPINILHLAVEISPYEVISLLVECGADVKAVDECGNTPFQLLKEFYSDYNNTEKVAMLLVSKEYKHSLNNFYKQPIKTK